MFTGDLVALGTSVMIHASRGGNLADYMRSLERVLAHEPRVLLPAHGARVDDPRALITGYLESPARARAAGDRGASRGACDGRSDRRKHLS